MKETNRVLRWITAYQLVGLRNEFLIDIGCDRNVVNDSGAILINSMYDAITDKPNNQKPKTCECSKCQHTKLCKLRDGVYICTSCIRKPHKWRY